MTDRQRFEIIVTVATANNSREHVREEHLRAAGAWSALHAVVGEELARLGRSGGHVEGFELDPKRIILVRSEDGVPVQVSSVELREKSAGAEPVGGHPKVAA